MQKKIKYFFKKLGNYQTEGITSKIELRRAQVFNYSILIESGILLINCIRHFLRDSYGTLSAVATTLFFLIFLYATKKIKREFKYVIFIFLGLIGTFFIMHYIDKTKDIIQVYIAVLLSTGVFLSGKKFYIMFFTAIIFYYGTFFSLKYHEIYNPLGFLTFIFLTLMVQLFIKDAEKNEKLIEKQILELKEVDVLKNRLFANISHEIRTPLTLIIGANEQQKQSKFTQIIASNANKLIELINQILDLSKIQAKQRVVQLKEINLHNYFQSIAIDFESLANKKNIKFNYCLNFNFEKTIIDEDALYKITTNLLMNAIKFSSANATIQFKVFNSHNRNLIIEVEDTGKGIEEENLNHIFEQFYHSEIGLEASSGIGLALVKELTDTLNGTITVNSKINVGSSFVVSIPCQFKKVEISETTLVRSKENVIENISPVVTNINLETQKEILLLVEDNEELRAFIKELLEDKFNIIEAVDGLDGKTKALEYIPDIIISDVMMPKMDGLTLLHNLKNEMTTSHIPVILLTAKAEEEDKLKGLYLQADDYITKPFHLKELVFRIQNKLNFVKKLQEKYKDILKPNYISTKLNSKDDTFLQLINTTVKSNLSSPNFGPEELAVAIGLSSSQVFRKLKALTNLSTSIYIRNIRLEEAKILLANKTATIAEIAYETGFSTPAYFTKCFKEYASISPSEFIEEQNNL